MLRETDRFQAGGDDGQIYTVVVLTHFYPSKVIRGEREPTQGASEYRTDDGSHVRQLDAGHYLVLATGVVLTPIDPSTLELVPLEITPDGPTA